VQLNCPKACNAGISWSPWLRREVGLPPLPPVNSGAAAGTGALQLYPSAGGTKPPPPADMLAAATQMHVRLKVYMHGGYQDLSGFSSAAPNEFLGMLGLTEACLYVMRMYQAIIEDLDSYGGRTGGGAQTHPSFTDSNGEGDGDGDPVFTFLERHKQRVDAILSAVKESDFQSDILSRSLGQWLQYADEAGEYIRSQLEGGDETESDGQVNAADGVLSSSSLSSSSSSSSYTLGLYRMIGLYKGREVAISLEPRITDESREVQRLVEERQKAKEATERRKAEERLRRLAELEAEARAKEQQWLQKERKLAQQREQEAEKARISELLRQAELAEKAAAVERARVNQQKATAAVKIGSDMSAATTPIAPVVPSTATADAKTSSATAGITTKLVAKPAGIVAANKAETQAQAAVEQPPREAAAAAAAAASASDAVVTEKVASHPPRPSVLHMNAKTEESVVPKPVPKAAAVVNERVKPEQVVAGLQTASALPEAAESSPAPLPSTAGASTVGGGDVDATMRQLLMEGLAAGGVTLESDGGLSTTSTAADAASADAAADAAPVTPEATSEAAAEEQHEAPESVDHAQGLPEGAEVEDWIQEVLKYASHGDIVQGSYEMHSGYDAFTDREGFAEPHIDGAKGVEEDIEGGYSTEELGHDPFRTRTVEFDGMFAEEGSNEYIPRRRRTGGCLFSDLQSNPHLCFYSHVGVSISML
jgi:hypothetical protein